MLNPTTYRQQLLDYAKFIGCDELYHYATTAKSYAITRRVVAMGAAVFAEMNK